MKNDYKVRGEVTAIFINSKKYGRLEALISTNKLEHVKEFPNSWYANWEKNTQSFYVRGWLPKFNGKQIPVRLHRWVTDSTDGMMVDHINHDGLINTDSNLRIVTNAENTQNKQSANRNSKSGILGVSWNKHGKWVSQLMVDNKKIYLGCFDDVHEAENIIIEARKKYMPFSQEALI